MKLKRLGILCSIVICITNCTTQIQCQPENHLQHFPKIKPLDLKIGDTPTPPSDIAFPISPDGLPDVNFIEENDRMSSNPQSALPRLKSLSSPPLLSAPQALPPRPEPSEASNYVSLIGQNGSVITVWALARGNWLWAYASFESQDFGNIRNWKLEPSSSREHFRFINQQLGSCMEAYRNGLIHSDCNDKNLAQDFELLPSSTGYSAITLASCSDQISPLKDQNWYIAPPILKATPQN